MSEDTLLGTVFQLLPGISKLISAAGMLVIGLFAILPQATGTAVKTAEYQPVANLVRPYNVVTGKTDSNVMVIEFVDFQCPYCGQIDPTFTQIQTEYKDKVKFVTKMYPLPIHSNAKISAYGALAANNQGKFKEYKDKLFASQDNPGLSAKTQENIAREIGLDMDKWNRDRVSDEIKERVATDVKDGETAKIPVEEGSTETGPVDGTPSFVFVKNDKVLYKKGVMTADEFRANLNKLLQ
ncbi:MAG: hypothetical protein OHK0017_09890 [Patescibacteria group bacterium]